MALWICEACGTAYSVDAPACPHCGSTEYLEEGMPKITKYGGASNEYGETVAEVPEAGNSDEEYFEELAEAQPSVTPYDAMLKTELQDELDGRELPVSGTKAELVERLVADDKESAMTEPEETAAEAAEEAAAEEAATEQPAEEAAEEASAEEAPAED